MSEGTLFGLTSCSLPQTPPIVLFSPEVSSSHKLQHLGTIVVSLPHNDEINNSNSLQTPKLLA